MFLFIVLGVICLAAAVYLLGDAVTMPARERHTSIRRAANYGRFRAKLGPGQQPFRQRVLLPLGDRLAGWTLKLHPKTNIDGVSARLLAAGLGRTISPTTFLALKSGVGIGGLVLGAVAGGALTGPGGVFLFATMLGGLGFIGPDFVISAKSETVMKRRPGDVGLNFLSGIRLELLRRSRSSRPARSGRSPSSSPGACP